MRLTPGFAEVRLRGGTLALCTERTTRQLDLGPEHGPPQTARVEQIDEVEGEVGVARQ